MGLLNPDYDRGAMVPTATCERECIIHRHSILMTMCHMLRKKASIYCCICSHFYIIY